MGSRECPPRRHADIEITHSVSLIDSGGSPMTSQYPQPSPRACPYTDMDEPVKSFLFGMAIIPLVARWSVGIPGVRRLSTVNHTDIRGLPPGLASGAGIGRWVEHA